MPYRRTFWIEAFTALALILAPFILPYLDFAPGTVNQILVWGLFGIGFDILFGYTGLLSFGQSAFYGTGGFIAAYLLINHVIPNVILALVIGTVGAAAAGVLVGVVALRRTGIYFAMITVAIAETFYFVEFSPLAEWTGGENGLPGVPTPTFALFGWSYKVGTGWSMYGFLAVCYFIGIVLALRIVRSPVGAILRAIRDNPLRARAVGHSVGRYKLTAFVVGAAYAGFAGGLLGVLQGFMPPDAFTFDTSGQLVMQTAIGGVGTLFGPLLGAAVWLYLRDFLQAVLGLGSAWNLVLGVIFVLLVCFLRRGLIGGLIDLARLIRKRRQRPAPEEAPAVAAPAAAPALAASAPAASAPEAPAGATAPVKAVAPHRKEAAYAGPALETRGLSKSFGGLAANADIDFVVQPGELRGIIGPNGAGKSTFFKMLTCEMAPDSGHIIFHGRDITGMDVSRVCHLGLTKTYQVNQLFTRLTLRENVVIAALAERRGIFSLDLLRRVDRVPGLAAQVENTLALVGLTARADMPVAELAYGEKRRLEIALALASSPSLLLLDEPLAGMSPQERAETVKLLKNIRHGRTLVVVEHDMDAMFELAERITVFHQGTVLADGAPADIQRNSQVQEAYLGGAAAA
jgi:branched-chain amino acid transport system permease protein